MEKTPNGPSNFEIWIQAQTLAEGEIRTTIPEPGLVIRTFKGKTFREYYVPNLDPQSESESFTQVAKATFFEDHNVQKPHFELETKIPDEGYPDIIQKVTLRGDEAEYLRYEKLARLNAGWRRAPDGTFIEIVTAGYTPVTEWAVGIGLNSFEEVTALKRTWGLDSEKHYGNKFTHVEGDEFGVRFTVYDEGKVTEEASIRDGRSLEKALSSFVPDVLLQDPASQLPELDQWRNADFFKGRERIGRLKIQHPTV